MTDLLHLMHHDLRRLARENERLREEVANAATAERQRLAGMASEEDREMVSNLIAESIRCGMWNAREAPLHAKDCSDKADGVAESLLARLAAARGEALEEAVRWCWMNPVDLQDKRQEDYVARAIRALLAAPTKGEGE